MQLFLFELNLKIHRFVNVYTKEKTGNGFLLIWMLSVFSINDFFEFSYLISY